MITSEALEGGSGYAGSDDAFAATQQRIEKLRANDPPSFSSAEAKVTRGLRRRQAAGRDPRRAQRQTWRCMGRPCTCTPCRTAHRAAARRRRS